MIGKVAHSTNTINVQYYQHYQSAILPTLSKHHTTNTIKAPCYQLYDGTTIPRSTPYCSTIAPNYASTKILQHCRSKLYQYLIIVAFSTRVPCGTSHKFTIYNQTVGKSISFRQGTGATVNVLLSIIYDLILIQLLALIYTHDLEIDSDKKIVPKTDLGQVNMQI